MRSAKANRHRPRIDRLESRILLDGLSFSAQTPNIVDIIPQKPIVVSLRNNGIMDIVAPDEGTNRISILLGNGNGTFQFEADPVVGNGPFAVATGDFNGDGIPDLVVTDTFDNTVSVLIGNGDGTFQTPATFSTGAGSSPEGVAVGDINGDGIADIVTTDQANDKVSILLGNGNGTFQAHSDISVGTSPVAVAVGDLNSTGRISIVTANAGSDSLSVLINQGGGTFGAAQPEALAVGAAPSDVIIGDLQNNGIADIIAANNGVGVNSVSVLLGNGDGTFQSHADHATGTRPYSVSLGDINNDGNLDIVTASKFDQNFDILLGNGNGTFQTFDPINDPNSNDVQYAAVGDFNGDGKLDISCSGNNFESVFLNTSSFVVNNFATRSHGVITVNGTAGDDVITMTLTGGNYVFTLNNRAPRVFPAVGVTAVDIFAGTGNDTITATSAVTIGINVNGGVGDDSIFGGAGNDTLLGGQGADTIFGAAGNDYIWGGGGADLLSGGYGNDSIYGGAGNDTLRGGAGNNVLVGMSGNDVIFAAVGATDSVYGGPGQDTCHALGNDSFPNHDVETILNS